ncbi:uncharacterized protein C8R40DRAFT_1167512 [Lentinula edodes]|uniref:uncharacterized protein n=1 Tax=Lentinula edodes TaxID=5353 RepID=UPI001E8D0715|nr:uncharacterized protein C8R40DRAFT_1167512 [Lentinula edodes]KAH7878112.1 hypothetical protein C8R40DRAFT_1167512 [Lentinula edodes]
MCSRLFALKYRLAAGPPLKIGNPISAALIDGLAEYRYFLDLGFEPENILVGGDSASAIIAYQLVQYTAIQLDAAYPPVALAGCLPASEIDTAWLSPSSLNIPNVELKGMFFKFSPTFILAGEAKMCRASMRVLWERMRVDMGVKVTYLKVAKPPHDLVGFEFMEPERSFAKRKIARWTDKVLSGSR